MNEKYYVVFDGTSAYVVGEEDYRKMEHVPFLMEIIYGPFESFREAVDKEEALNMTLGI